jgi:hypothetical protein
MHQSPKHRYEAQIIVNKTKAKLNGGQMESIVYKHVFIYSNQMELYDMLLKLLYKETK